MIGRLAQRGRAGYPKRPNVTLGGGAGSVEEPGCVGRGSARRMGTSARVFAPELVDAPGGVEDLLLAGVEGMARGANLHMHFPAQG